MTLDKIQQLLNNQISWSYIEHEKDVNELNFKNENKINGIINEGDIEVNNINNANIIMKEAKKLMRLARYRNEMLRYLNNYFSYNKRNYNQRRQYNSNNNMNNNYNKNKNKIKCYECQKFGHVANDCPNKKKIMKMMI